MSRVHEALSRARATEGSPEAENLLPAGGPLFPIEGEQANAWASEPLSEMEPAGEATEAGHEGPVLDAPVRQVAEKLVLSAEAHASSIEQYRKLAARLHMAQAEHGIKVVMVASALPSEGKTLTATNLALTLSESYERNVLLIDGDLRRPSVHEMFRIQNLSGLNDGLRSGADRKVPLVSWSDHLTLVTAGRPDPDPMKVLVSPRMQKVIKEAASRFDWVIIDTPPVGLLTDASLFSAMVDTAVLVVQAGRTPYADIQRAIGALGRERIFGVVLNRAKPRNAGYGYDYKYAYGTDRK